MDSQCGDWAASDQEIVGLMEDCTRLEREVARAMRAVTDVRQLGSEGHVEHQSRGESETILARPGDEWI